MARQFRCARFFRASVGMHTLDSAVPAKRPVTSKTAAPSALFEQPRVAYALAALSGLFYFLAFPGIDWWPLSFVALAPLIVALRGQAPKRAAALGWTAGFTMTMLGFYWMVEMLQQFGGFSLPVGILFTALVCGYQAGRIALLGWLCARGEQRGWPFGAVFAAAFAASELLYPLLFPWFYGATVHQVPALIQVVELGNPMLLGLVLVAPNLAIAELVTAKLRQQRPRLALVAALCAVPALAAIYGAVRIPQIDAEVAAAPKARVGLVQANMSLFGKRENVQEGLDRHLRLTRELTEAGGVDLVVWSETSDMSAVDESTIAQHYPRAFTAGLGVPLIFGAILMQPVQDSRGRVYLNSAVATDRSGQVTSRYDKQLLLAFGEYLPFGERFPWLHQWLPAAGVYVPGRNVEPLKVNGRRVAMCICLEDIIPSFVNQVMRDSSPDLLVNITNDAWFGDTTAPWIHVGMARLRAVEHRRFLVRATNSGVSAFVDPVGRITAHTDTFKQQTKVAQVAWLNKGTPYEVYGDIPWWLLTAVALAFAFVRRPLRSAAAGQAPATAREEAVG